MNRALALTLQAAILACSTSTAVAPAARNGPAPPPTPSSAPTSRHYVLISDLHFGPGHTADGKWDPIDDFRWPRALSGFLDFISKWGHDNVDLIILGDFFELWQHPAIPCAAQDPDLGCTTTEMKKVVGRIVEQHHGELVSLWSFAEKGTNRLIVVPGNHDAALLSDVIWGQVSQSVGHPNARVTRSVDGYWTSDDGFILGEHGHQIGIDVSGYGRLWPAGFRGAESAPYPRPWGQLFVESFFDTAEVTFPIIDNVIPQSKAVGILLKNQNVSADAAQVARFLAFNAVRTSLSQKVTLNIPTPDSQKSETHGWDVAKGRSLGYKLFADSLADGDWWRDALLQKQEPYWDGVRSELKKLAADPEKMTTAQVVTLCDRIALLAKDSPDSHRERCTSQLALSAASSLIPEATILASHFKDVLPKYPKVGLFVYGHTHEMAPKFTVPMKDGRSIDVLNTGAFQRLTDVAGLTALQKDRTLATELDVLKLVPEDLKPCYSAVLIEYHGRDPDPVLKYWYMAEEDGEGKFLEPCDAKCPRIAKKCGE
jgi:UDP-2,3-diacylglucosamine pyrophosphatase LpxH